MDLGVVWAIVGHRGTAHRGGDRGGSSGDVGNANF